jgi:hypothetical protein
MISCLASTDTIVTAGPSTLPSNFSNEHHHLLSNRTTTKNKIERKLGAHSYFGGQKQEMGSFAFFTMKKYDD